MPDQITLQDLPGAIPVGQGQTPIEQDEVAFQAEQLANSAVIKEVVQNYDLGTSFMQSRALQTVWNTSELLLRAYVRSEKWKGSTDQERSHLGIPILAEQFYSLLQSTQQSLFSGLRPFQIDPSGSTELDVALAQEAIISSLLKTCGPKGGTFKQEMRNVNYDAFLYGTGVAFYGWKIKNYPVIRRRRKAAKVGVPSAIGNIDIPQGDQDELEEFTEWREVNTPVFEHVPIRRFRCAPDCRRSDVRFASWAARLIYLSAYDLDNLRDVEGYTIPTREQLIGLTTPQKLTGTEQNPLDYFGSAYPDLRYTNPQKAWPEYYDEKNNVDPLAQKWECIDYWTNNRHVMVLEKQFIIFNGTHDFVSGPEKCHPFLSYNFREAPDSFWGWGLGMWLGDFQRIATGVVNAFFDDLNLNLMGTYARPRGLNTSTQADFIFPGKVFQYDVAAGGGTPGSGGGFQPLTRNSTGLDIMAVVDKVKQWASAVTGIGAGTTGSNPGPTGNLRTAAGSNLLAGGEMVKMQDLVDQICDLVVIPFLTFCVEHSRKLKPSQIKALLSAEMEKAFKGDPLDVINGDYKVTISAGTRLQARLALEAKLGFIVQILQAPGMSDQLEVQGKKIMYDELFKTIVETTGYPYYNQWVKPMDDDDKQRAAAKSQAAQQQSKLALVGAQTQSKIAVNENQAESRAMLEAQKRAYEDQDKGVEGI